MACLYPKATVLSFLVVIGIHLVARADEILPNVGGAGGPGAVCFGGDFVVSETLNPTVRCEGGKVMHPEVANYLLLKHINDGMASSLASQDRFQKDALAKLQHLSEVLVKRRDAFESDLRRTIVRTFESLPRELMTSEAIVTLRTRILDAVDAHIRNPAETGP